MNPMSSGGLPSRWMGIHAETRRRGGSAAKSEQRTHAQRDERARRQPDTPAAQLLFLSTMSNSEPALDVPTLEQYKNIRSFVKRPAPHPTKTGSPRTLVSTPRRHASARPTELDGAVATRQMHPFDRCPPTGKHCPERGGKTGKDGEVPRDEGAAIRAAPESCAVYQRADAVRAQRHPL